jgi:hypothetical protein
LHAITQGLAVAKVSSSHANQSRLYLSFGTYIFQGFKPHNQRLRRLLVGVGSNFRDGILKNTVMQRISMQCAPR